MPSRAAQGRAGLWPSALYIFIAGAEHSPPQSMPGRCGAAGRSPQPIGAAAPSGAGCRRVQWHVKERASARAAARPPRPVQAVAPACTPRDVPGIIFLNINVPGIMDGGSRSVAARAGATPGADTAGRARESGRASLPEPGSTPPSPAVCSSRSPRDDLPTPVH
jgi:hypothetical protein